MDVAARKQQQDPSSPAEDLGGVIGTLCDLLGLSPEEQQDTAEIVDRILSSLEKEGTTPRM